MKRFKRIRNIVADVFLLSFVIGVVSLIAWIWIDLEVLGNVCLTSFILLIVLSILIKSIDSVIKEREDYDKAKRISEAQKSIMKQRVNENSN